MIELSSVFVEEVGPSWHKPESATNWNILLLVANGRLTYTVNGETIPLAKGDLLYIPEGAMRAGAAVPGQTHQKYAVLFHSAESPTSIPLLDRKRVQLLRTGSFDYLKQRFAQLQQHWIGQMPYHLVTCQGIALEILGLVSRELEAAAFAPRKLMLVSAIRQYILDHYREPVRIEQLAQLVDRTPNYVTRIFREVTGQPPIDYLHQVRISAARDLMSNSQLTIGQIAEYLGYCDQSYFNRMYKRRSGHPPSSHFNGGEASRR